jgi:YD repeat-containing protein
MILRGNLRVLIKKLRLLTKQRAFVPLTLFFSFLLLAGFFAIPRAVPDGMEPVVPRVRQNPQNETDTSLNEVPDSVEDKGAWAPLAPQRWFRSNAGGMTLEEIPSRLGALRNKYALAVDYVPPHELDTRLSPFYRNNYDIEIRVLYEQGKETRKQWLFLDSQDTVRLNAVFTSPPDENQTVPDAAEEITAIDNSVAEAQSPDIWETSEPEDSPPEAALGASTGFIEVYDEKARITGDYWFFESGGEIATTYFYNTNVLTKAETRRKILNTKPEDRDETIYRLMYTDSFRYNRFYSLRNVERLYHDSVDAEPVRLLFSSSVLATASDKNFLSDRLFWGSEFLGNLFAELGYRLIYDTDSRGRILTQTMLNDEDEVVWVIKNTWSGDRVISILKTEGDDEKRTEYEYDSAGNRIVQRDINNGVLERLVHIDGYNETEELYLNGVIILRAYWENGRKVREERVQR